MVRRRGIDYYFKLKYNIDYCGAAFGDHACISQHEEK